MFGISLKEIKRTLAVLLAFALVLTSTPLSSFATDVGSLLNSLVKNSGEVAAISGGDASGNQGAVSHNDVIVNITGNGTGQVAINGESKASGSKTEVSTGDAVTLTITPGSNDTEGWRSYIKSATDLSDESLLEGMSDSHNVFTTTKTITKDETWKFEFGKEYKYGFDVNDANGGTVTLTNEAGVNYTYSDASQFVWVNSESSALTLNITPNEHYRVQYVKVGENVFLSDSKATSVDPIQVDVAATDITVKFVKVYEVTVNYENGTVTVDGNALATGTTYIGEWDDNNKAPFVATPSTGYHVSSVVINGQEQLTADVTSYTTELNKNVDYVITVIFEINEYKIILNGAPSGSADIYVNGSSTPTNLREFTVNHGDSLVWKIAPAAGMVVETVQVSAGDLVRTPGTLEYTLSNIEGNTTVDVSIVSIETVDDTDNLIQNIGANATVIAGKYYDINFTDNSGVAVSIVRTGVMADGTTPFVVVPSGTNIKLTAKDAYSYVAFGGLENGLTSFVEWTSDDISEISVDSIYVSAVATNYVASDICMVDCGYKIFLDGSAPTVEFKPVSDTYSSEDVVVKFSVDDGELGAGIDKVTYWVEADGIVTQTEADATKTSTGYEFTVDASVNDYDEVIAYVRVTDLAGNENDTTNDCVAIKISATAPEVTINMADNGTIDETSASEGYYKVTRTATITIVDRAFSEEKALEGLLVNGEKPTGVNWTAGTSAHSYVAKVEFAEDGVYEWQYTYTNEAGLSDSDFTLESAHVESVWEFVIDTDVADVTLETLTEEKGDTADLFNDNVEIAVKVEDGQLSSGIREVSYTIEGETTNTVITNGTFDSATGIWNGSFVISKDTYNRNDIKVTVTALDMASNTITSEAYEFSIDKDAPKVEIKGANDAYLNTAPVEAKITIIERAENFDSSKVSLQITAVDSEGNPIEENELVVYIKEWSSDGDEHNATVVFETDANYTWSVICEDKAGNVGESNSLKFTLDTKEPTGTITVGAGTWSGILSGFTPASKFNTSVGVTIAPTDATSPIEKVEYYRVEGSAASEALNLEALQDHDEWTTFVEGALTVDTSKQFVVYVRITDKAGNVGYLSTAGIIVDKAAPTISAVSPGTSTTFNGVGLSNSDVSVGFTVEDPYIGDTLSGLKTITYQIVSNGVATGGETIEFSGSKYVGSVNVQAANNNTNDVKVEIIATDQAGNRSTAVSNTFMIDVTVPTIHVSYDNNAFDSDSDYAEARIATVTITERNFVPENVLINITNSDGVVPTISGWTSSGSGDDTIHVATIAYTADGDYTFDITFTDAAGNVAGPVIYADGTTNPTEFTIDQTQPAINVKYDNNDAKNDKYFAEERTATITIIEHNFIVDRVVLTQTAKLDGTNITIPEIEWTHNGDVHEGTIAYDADGDYTFDIKMTDMAGNENSDVDFGNSVAAKDFTVDTEIATPVVEGVEDGKSYKDAVVPTISYADVNFEVSEIKLLRTRNGEINVDVTEQFITGMEENKYGGEGTNDTFAETADNDGIYTLIVKVADKAGNEKTETVVFTVNRYGSVYAFNDYLVSLQDSYVQKVDGSIVITEYNPDKLVEDSVKVEITKDGTPLSNVVFTINTIVDASTANGEDGWYQYEYVIDASNFIGDGIYKISVSSEDAAGNKPETANFEDCTVLFRVDTVNAEITSIRGLETDIVNAENQTVEFDVFDAIGLKKVTVYVNDVEYDAFEEFENIVNFTGSIVLTEGTNQQIRLVVEDIAGNVTDTASETFAPAFAFNNTITVSTNFWIRFMANKPLFFGTIGGVVALVGGSVVGISMRGRKKKTSKK